MPNGFTPADRSDVVDTIEKKEWVVDISPCGPGLLLTVHRGEDDFKAFSGLIEQFGWHLAGYEMKETGDVAILMPITEVPE